MDRLLHRKQSGSKLSKSFSLGSWQQLQINRSPRVDVASPPPETSDSNVDDDRHIDLGSIVEAVAPAANARWIVDVGSAAIIFILFYFISQNLQSQFDGYIPFYHMQLPDTLVYWWDDNFFTGQEFPAAIQISEKFSGNLID